MNSQMNQAKQSTLVVGLAIKDSEQGVNPPKSADNLFAADKRLVGTVKVPIALMARFEVEAMLRMEEEKASASVTSFQIRNLILVEIAKKIYRIEYVDPKFQKFDDRRSNTQVNVLLFFDSMGASFGDKIMFDRVHEVAHWLCIDVVCEP